jgi:Fur family ferric uptake transcriptional regulator
MSLDEIVTRLKQSGHKVTPQRISIIKLIIESQELLTPSALFEKVHQLYPEVGEGTVYRTLSILSELGLVCVVHTDNNVHSYTVRPAGHHDHLVCSECGKVINFTDCNISELEKRLMLETGYIINEHRLDLYGKCRECLQNNR